MKSIGSLLNNGNKSGMVTPLVDVVFNLMITMFIFLMIYMAVVTPRPDEITPLKILKTELPPAISRAPYTSNIPVGFGSGQFTFYFPQEPLQELAPAATGKELVSLAPQAVEDTFHVPERAHLTLSGDTGLVSGHLLQPQPAPPGPDKVLFDVLVVDTMTVAKIPREAVRVYRGMFLYLHEEIVIPAEVKESRDTSEIASAPAPACGTQPEPVQEPSPQENQDRKAEEEDRVKAYYAVRATITVPVDPQAIPYDPTENPLRLAGAAATVGATATIGMPCAMSLNLQGGIEPYSFAVASGVLPPGIEMNTATGMFSGTPTAPGDYPVSVEVKDAQTISWQEARDRREERGTPLVSLNLLFEIAPYVPLSLRIALPEYGRVGSPVEGAVIAEGGVGHRTFSSAGLPQGVTLNAETGAITGTPVETGVYSVEVRVNDEHPDPAKQQASTAITWRVIERKPEIGISGGETSS